ncbi:MAG TPA: hypothetical protein VFG30_18390 [Polyangiales bacterium]|nr:hypothetical protein [Polyangiales bacterium]
MRGCFFLEPRQALVRRLSEPVAGMDPITQNGAYSLSSFYIQLELASRGSEGGLGTAEELEAAPMYATLGKQLRLVAALSQGDFEGTRRAREERELLSLQSTFTDQHRETSVRWEAVAIYRAADLLGLKQLIQAQTARAARFPGAQPLLHMLRAQYLLLAAEPERSLAEVHAGRALAPPLTHACGRELARVETQARLALDRVAKPVRVRIALKRSFEACSSTRATRTD